MNHDIFEELVAAETLGAIGSEELRALNAHRSAGCASCAEIKRSFGNAARHIPDSVREHTPPHRLKSALLTEIETLEAASARPWVSPQWGFALAAAALLAVLFPTLEDSFYTRRISTMAGSAQQIQLSDKVTVVVAPESELFVRPYKNGYEVTLKRGGIANLVKTGTPYVVVTPVVRTEVHGTAFYVNMEEPQKAYVCLCTGKIAITGKAYHRDLATTNHEAFFITSGPQGLTDTPAGKIHH